MFFFFRLQVYAPLYPIPFKDIHISIWWPLALTLSDKSNNTVNQDSYDRIVLALFVSAACAMLLAVLQDDIWPLLEALKPSDTAVPRSTFENSACAVAEQAAEWGKSCCW